MASGIVSLKQRNEPGFSTGFARQASESANPDLWRGIINWWEPGLGRSTRGNENLGVRGYPHTELTVSTNDPPGLSIIGRHLGLEYSSGSIEDHLGIDSDIRSMNYPVSLVAWFQTTDATAQGRILTALSANGSFNNYYAIQLSPSHEIRYIHRGASSASNPSVSSSPLTFNDGKPHCIVAGSTAADNHYMYIDGRLIGTDSTTTSGGDPVLDRFRIGSWVRSTNDNEDMFFGVIGGVGWYHRTFTASDAKRFYADPLALFRRRISVPFIKTEAVVPSFFTKLKIGSGSGKLLVNANSRNALGF